MGFLNFLRRPIMASCVAMNFGIMAIFSWEHNIPMMTFAATGFVICLISLITAPKGDQ